MYLSHRPFQHRRHKSWPGHPISAVLSGWPFVREGCVAMLGQRRSEKIDGVG